MAKNVHNEITIQVAEQSKTTVLIIGLGSIGKRHVRIMSELETCQFLYAPTDVHHVDEAWRRRYDVIEFSQISQCLVKGPDFAIVANATTDHISSVRKLIDAEVPFLLEKPVAVSMDGLQTLTDQIDSGSLPVLVGFQLRYDECFKVVQETLKSRKIGKPLAFHGYVGQYLPDWRPSRDYRSTVSASKKSGGGVVADICHQIDIAVCLMGPVDSLYATAGHVSKLDIETEDIANIILIHKSGLESNIHLNYLDRARCWNTRIIGESGTIDWDNVGQTVSLYNADTKRSEKIIHRGNYDRDSVFREQLKHWIRVHKRLENPIVPFKTGVYITEIICAIEESARQNRLISLG